MRCCEFFTGRLLEGLRLLMQAEDVGVSGTVRNGFAVVEVRLGWFYMVQHLSSWAGYRGVVLTEVFDMHGLGELEALRSEMVGWTCWLADRESASLCVVIRLCR